MRGDGRNWMELLHCGTIGAENRASFPSLYATNNVNYALRDQLRTNVTAVAFVFHKGITSLFRMDGKPRDICFETNCFTIVPQLPNTPELNHLEWRNNVPSKRTSQILSAQSKILLFLSVWQYLHVVWTCRAFFTIANCNFVGRDFRAIDKTKCDCVNSVLTALKQFGAIHNHLCSVTLYFPLV